MMLLLKQKIDEALEKKTEPSLKSGSKRFEVEDLLKQKPPSVEAIIDQVIEEDKVRKNFFRPSMIGGCTRANVFHYMDAPRSPQQPSAMLRRILDQGTAIHEVAQKYLSQTSEYFFAPESKVDIRVRGARVRGSSDGILIRKKDMYRFGLEIKSIGEAGWKEIQKGPKSEHVTQASIYSRLSGVWWITIVYWRKSNSAIKEWPVSFDKGRWATIQGMVENYYSYVKKKKLPMFRREECSPELCAFVDVCKKNGGDP